MGTKEIPGSGAHPALELSPVVRGAATGSSSFSPAKKRSTTEPKGMEPSLTLFNPFLIYVKLSEGRKEPPTDCTRGAVQRRRRTVYVLFEASELCKYKPRAQDFLGSENHLHPFGLAGK